jgi:hypothetical protein
MAIKTVACNYSISKKQPTVRLPVVGQFSDQYDQNRSVRGQKLMRRLCSSITVKCCHRSRFTLKKSQSHPSLILHSAWDVVVLPDYKFWKFEGCHEKFTEINMRITTSLRIVFCLLSFCIPSRADRCVDNGNDEFVCTQDVLLHRASLEARSADFGEQQRIEGSTDEKKRILEVLKRMDDYFMNEVSAMPEYEYVRSRW